MCSQLEERHFPFPSFDKCEMILDFHEMENIAISRLEQTLVRVKMTQKESYNKIVVNLLIQKHHNQIHNTHLSVSYIEKYIPEININNNNNDDKEKDNKERKHNNKEK